MVICCFSVGSSYENLSSWTVLRENWLIQNTLLIEKQTKFAALPFTQELCVTSGSRASEHV